MDEIKQELGKAAGDAVERMVEGGWQEDDSVDLIVELLDVLTPAEALIPGPLGKAAEEVLDKAAEALVRRLVEVLRADPEKLRAKAKNAKPKRRKRLLRRARRIEGKEKG